MRSCPSYTLPCRSPRPHLRLSAAARHAAGGRRARGRAPGRQHAIGIVTGCSDTSELPLDKLKPIDSVIDAESLFSLACGASCAGPAITITTPLAKCCSMRCRSCCGKANRPRPRRCGNGSPPKRARHPARKPETRAETAAGAGGAVATPGLSPPGQPAGADGKPCRRCAPKG